MPHYYHTFEEKKEPETPQDGVWERWQGVEEFEAETAVVLQCVFAQLSSAELWRCGAVCRAWRRAAGDPVLWRRLLLPRAAPRTLRALEQTHGYEWSFRKEYALQSARWERCGRLQASGPGAAPLACAALHSNDSYLALVDEDAHVTVWERTDALWAVRWSGAASAEWRGVAQAQWAPRAARLLLAGRLALVERYEMLVLHFDADWRARVECRSASGPGGAGCWADDDRFLSLRLRLLAPGLACTTVWLNAATQETYSEFAGVSTPLLRIYNEAAAQVSHILVAEVSSDDSLQSEALEVPNEFSCQPSAAYYSALRPRKVAKDKKRLMLIAAGGVTGGTRGKAEALLAWPLQALEVPMLWVDDALAQRVQHHRERMRNAPLEPAAAPEEHAVRALCSAPVAQRSLRSQIYGIVLHPSGGCVWATTEAGAACVSLPALAPLLRVQHSVPASAGHYLLPCVDNDFFVTPEGSQSGRVCVWTARCGRPAARLPHGAAALGALLPRRTSTPHCLMVLATDALHIVRKLTEERASGARRGSCSPVEIQKCPPCVSPPCPTCRAPARASPLGERRVCRPPPAARRPPCPAPAPARPLTCEHSGYQANKFGDISEFAREASGSCGAGLDRVALRLAAAERARRADYEREVALHPRPRPPRAAPYRLAAPHHFLRATDGRDYIVSNNATDGCPPHRVRLKPTDECEISRGYQLDPCDHHPRIFLEIDRSSDGRFATSEKVYDKISHELDSSKNSTCPRSSCKSRSSDDNWCKKPLPPKTLPSNCKEPSLTELLLQQSRSHSGTHFNPQRNLHSNIRDTSFTDNKVTDLQKSKQDHRQDRLTSALDERMELKEAGRGRVTTANLKENKNQNIAIGNNLEIKVPPDTKSVRVRVSLNVKPADIRNSPILDNINCRDFYSSPSDAETDSWLSIKNIQKKISGYRKKDTTAEVKKQEDYGTCQHPKDTVKPISKKQPTCSLDRLNEKPENKSPCCHPPPSNTSPKPHPDSPCAPKPKQHMPRYIASHDFLPTY